MYLYPAHLLQLHNAGNARGHVICPMYDWKQDWNEQLITIKLSLISLSYKLYAMAQIVLQFKQPGEALRTHFSVDS